MTTNTVLAQDKEMVKLKPRINQSAVSTVIGRH